MDLFRSSNHTDMTSFLKGLVSGLMLCSGTIFAQNFNFSLVKDSSSYTELSSPQVVSSGESFLNKRFTIHFPFAFNFCGSSTDSLIIENGYVVFNPLEKWSLISFNDFSSNKDTLQSYPASISYAVSGTGGNRILKIEFKNLSRNTYSYYDNLSYQIWLYENGSTIEYHIGNNSYALLTENEMQIILGAINQQMDTDDKAFLISGDPSTPGGQTISGDNELVFLTNMPCRGILYRLTPSN